MNSDGVQKLQEVGAQKIYEDTHIPVDQIQAILHESFEGLEKVQFIGFVSILEREYGVDLSELKQKGIVFYNEKKSTDTITEDGIFIAPKKQKNFTLFYILLALVALIVALYYTVEYADKNMKNSQFEENITAGSVNKELQKIAADVNISKKDENKTLQDVNTTQKSAVKVEKAVQKSLKIIARSKVWMGYIDVETNKKYQKTFTGEFDLDPNKEWLLIFGHGYIDVIVDAEKKEFNLKTTLRLLYKNGTITQLSVDEFKRLNRGHSW